MKRAVRAALAGIVLFGAPASAEPLPRKTNVVLVSVDTLRLDHLGAYGYARQTSPRLERFFKDGFLFSRAFSVSSHTRPAHASLLFGVAPGVHGVTDPEAQQRVPDGLRSLAEVFRDSGYRTGAFMGGGNVSRSFGFDRGFDESREGDGAGVNGNLTDFDPRPMLDWLERNKGGPFFLFVHTYIPHSPYLPPAASNLFLREPYAAKHADIRRRMLDVPDRLYDDVQEEFWKRFPRTAPSRDELIDLYDGDVRYADDSLGGLWDALERAGLLANTLVVLVSDHGELFHEYGHYGHPPFLYDELMRVPLLVRMPGGARPGLDTERLISLVDVPVSLLSAAGLAVPEQFQGEAFLPASRPAAARRFVFAETALWRTGKTLFAVRDAGSKLLVVEDEPEAFYSFANGGEGKNLLRDAAQAAAVAELLDALRAHKERNDASRLRLKSVPARLDGATEEALKELGYLR